MSRPLSIGAFTAIRSEYGPMRPLLLRLHQDPSFDLKLLVGGAHLRPEFGYTVSEIEKDGLPITKRLPFLDNLEREPLSRSLGRLQQLFGEWLATEKPELFILVGDRSELLPIATALLIEKIPIAHFSGGETTEGSIDNQIRHAITKMAHLHFPANETFKRNIMRMGEEEWRICVSGELSLDEVLSLPAMNKEALFAELGLPLDRPIILTTFHPETLENKITPAFVEGLMEELCNDKELFFLLTAANFDEEGHAINTVLRKMEKLLPNLRFVESLGKTRYYSVLRYCNLVLGNSSSGIFEVQSFGIPAVNVGDRQKGRLANPNVIHAAARIDDVKNAVRLGRSQEMRQKFKNLPNIYGDGHAVERAVDFIKSVNLRNLTTKKDIFFDPK